jgi:hypothetical protein
MTAAGAILGTAGYMSPEQARGKSLDAQTDIWAFGCVLYEMLTGRRAFPGESVTDVLSAVIGKDPAWDALPHTTPAAVRRLLRRCLMKDRRHRLASASDVRLEIEDALSPTASTATATPPHTPRQGALAFSLGLAVGLIAAVGGYVFGTSASRAAAPSPAVTGSSSSPTARTSSADIGITSRRTAGGGVHRAGRGRSAIYAALDELESHQVAGTKGAVLARWPLARLSCGQQDSKGEPLWRVPDRAGGGRSFSRVGMASDRGCDLLRAKSGRRDLEGIGWRRSRRCCDATR